MTLCWQLCKEEKERKTKKMYPLYNDKNYHQYRNNNSCRNHTITCRDKDLICDNSTNTSCDRTNPAQDVTPTPPNQPVIITITTVTLPISLPIQTASGPLQTVGGIIVPLIPTDDLTVQILSLDTHLTETTEVLDPSDIRITDDIPEMILNNSINKYYRTTS